MHYYHVTFLLIEPHIEVEAEIAHFFHRDYFSATQVVNDLDRPHDGGVDNAVLGSRKTALSPLFF